MFIIKGKNDVYPLVNYSNTAMENIYIFKSAFDFQTHLDVVVFLEVDASMHMGLLEQPTKDESREVSQG